MALSRIWKARLLRWRGHARTAATVAVCAAALFGAAAGCKVFLAPDRPDIAAIAQRVGNQGDQVGAFASDFVVTWLTATTAAARRAAAVHQPARHRAVPADHPGGGGHRPAGGVGHPHRHRRRCRRVRRDGVGHRTALRLSAIHPLLLPGAGVDVELPAPRADPARADQRPRPRRGLPHRLPAGAVAPTARSTRWCAGSSPPT